MSGLLVPVTGLGPDDHERRALLITDLAAQVQDEDPYIVWDYLTAVPAAEVQRLLMFALAAHCPDLPFLVVESWNLEPTWQRLCRWRALQLGNVEWQAPTDDMRGVYARARMLLMPSVWEESFGRTVVEAQLNGLPVLASQRGALPENVGDGGLVLDPHAPVADWAAALRRLYHDGEGWGDAARRKGLGHAAATPLIAGELMTRLAAHAHR